MSNMTARTIATATIATRVSTSAPLSHYTYDQADFKFDNSNITYDYVSYRGELTTRDVATVQMRGR
jgi:hypothetical protein